MSNPLHPTEHRSYRELYAALRHLIDHWERLGERLAGSAVGAELAAGADTASALLVELSELTEARGLHGRPLAAGGGAAIAAVRNVVGDRFLERNQAVRLALLDVHHARELLAYLARAAERRGDTAALAFCDSARRRLGEVIDGVRRAYVALAEAPDRATAPVDVALAGRAASRLGLAIGALGEWTDARLAGRARRSNRG